MNLKIRGKLIYDQGLTRVDLDLSSRVSKIFKTALYQLKGEHDIDVTFVKQIRNHGIEVLPRILVNLFQVNGPKPEKLSEAQIDKIVNIMLQQSSKHKFDGFVIECGWLSFISLDPASHVENIKDLFIPTLISVSKKFKAKAARSLLILVIPPISRFGSQYFSDEHFKLLKTSFDYFSLMTYDFQYDPKSPYYIHDKTVHPNAPYTWVESSVNSILRVPSGF